MNDDWRNQYDTIKILKEGNFSKIYKVKEKYSGKLRALKLINLQKFNEIQGDDFEYQIKNKRKLFLNEINIMKLIEGKNKENINTIKLIEYFEKKGEFVIIMELCDENMADYIKKRDPLTSEEIFEFLKQLNNTFKIMNENKIVHRDIKLENILIKFENGNIKKYIVKLSDYGCSKQMKDSDEKFSSVIGSVNCIAPEIIKEEKYNEKCDLWSLGIIIFFLFFKKYPFKGNSFDSVLKKIEESSKIKKTGNQKLDDLIEKLLRKAPKKRLSWEEYFKHPFINQRFENEFFNFLQENIKDDIDVYEIYEKKIKDYNKKHKIKHYKQLPIYIMQEENNLDYNINCLEKDKNVNIPVIIINGKEYEKFKKILPYFQAYAKFKNNTILNSKFILPKNKKDKINHINYEKDTIFIAESNFNSNYHLKKEYNEYSKLIEDQFLNSEELKNYIEEWVRTIFNILAEYINFILNKKSLYFFCDKCNCPNICINILNNNIINNINKNNGIKKNKNKDQKDSNVKEIETKIQKYTSIQIANSLIKLMNFDYKVNNKNNKIINKIYSNQNNFPISNPPKKNENEKNINKKENKDKNINIIYYDENINVKDKISNIYDDSRLFERVISNGTFILATEEKKLNLILNEINKNNENNDYYFHLIVTGSKCEKVMKIIGEEKSKIFKDSCIYTGNYSKYKNYIKKYDIIKNVYTEEDEIISFIKENESDDNIFQTYKLINFYNYIDKYYYLHKEISNQYIEENLNNGILYEEYFLPLIKNMNTKEDLNINIIMELLKSVNDENRRKNIVREYTNDILYMTFNKWLNELDILSYRKFAYFIALLMYGIIDINNETKGQKSNMQLFRGIKMSYINLSFYERNINKLIVFPSFTSCSSNKNIAKSFAGRNREKEGQFLPIEIRKEIGKFSVFITINYIYKNGWEPSAFSISHLSAYPNEEEVIFLPFSFFIIKSVDINFDNYEANITMENIGKKCLLEKKIQEENIIIYNEKEKILQEKEEKQYSNTINKILTKKYPFLYEDNENHIENNI